MQIVCRSSTRVETRGRWSSPLDARAGRLWDVGMLNIESLVGSLRPPIQPSPLRRPRKRTKPSPDGAAARREYVLGLVRSTLSRGALKIALILAEECDWTTGVARRPLSARALACEARRKQCDVRRVLRELRALGWIAVHARAALQVPVYRLTTPRQHGALALVPSAT